MNRIHLVVLAGLSWLAAAAVDTRTASGHGGVFRGPGGQVPPGLRPLGDPPPPPPVPGPDPTPEPGPEPRPPETGAPPPAPPTSGPAPTTGDPTGGGEGTGRRTAPIGFDHWSFWWEHEKDEVLGLKESLYRLRFSKESPLFALGGESDRGSELVNDATRLTEREVAATIVPALLRIARERLVDPDVEGAAWLALGKLTSDPAHVRTLAAVLGDAKRPPLVRESAALALGVLRRGEGRRAFDARDLDAARDACFAAFEDEDAPTRVRAFAAMAIGMLGDQPSAAPAAPRLFALLRGRHADAEMPVALLVALSLQRPETVTPEMLEALATCAGKERLFGERAGALVCAHAALALGRLGTDLQVPSLLNALTLRRTSNDVKRSAAVALGALAPRLDEARRAEVAAALGRAAEAKDTSTRHFALASLARVLRAEVASGRPGAVRPETKSVQALLRAARDGQVVTRPFGALALGLVGRALGANPATIEGDEFRVAALGAVREGLEDPRLDPRTRAGFAVALGLLRDAGSGARLVALVSDRVGDPELRGYAALALGLVGEPTRAAVDAVRAAVRERGVDAVRQQAAVALALLVGGDAVEPLLEELEAESTQAVLGQALVALGQVGDERAIAPLLRIAGDPTRPAGTRALAVAGLGLVGDLERRPSLSLLSSDLNYRAVTPALAEALTIL